MSRRRHKPEPSFYKRTAVPPVLPRLTRSGSLAPVELEAMKESLRKIGLATHSAYRVASSPSGLTTAATTAADTWERMKAQNRHDGHAEQPDGEWWEY